MHRLRLRKPSPAMAVAVVALVAALGGTAAASFGPFKGDKIIKKHSLSGSRLKNHSITRNQVNLGRLGKVPSATRADTANEAALANAAANATNADKLGGAAASAYERRPQWALVDRNGMVLAQSGGITVNSTNASVGQYFLNFGSSLANRPVSVVLHYGDGGLTGDVSATPCGGSSVSGGFDCLSVAGVNDANHLFVRTQSNSGGNAPFGFYVVVGS